MSLCGPRAVARLTGQQLREVLAFVRERRSRNGKRRSLRGGTDFDELQAALNAAGFELGPGFTKRRVRLKALAAEGLTGAWLLGERDHYFAVRSSQELARLAARRPRAVIVEGWEVRKLE